MFRPVKQRHKRVAIIGGGESLRDFDFNLLNDFDGKIITVNNVIKHLKRADYWITVDPCLDGKPQDNMINKRSNCHYFACYPEIGEDNKQWYPIVDGIQYLERIVPYKADGVDMGFFGLQEDKSKITTGDSVYSALGLAYHMEATEIILLGVDCYGYGHWYDTSDPYNKGWGDKFSDYVSAIPKIYSHCVQQFNLRGAKIVNGSKESKIDCFERMTHEQAIKYFD